MTCDLIFDKPKRLVDPELKESYFQFVQSCTTSEYNVIWDPVNKFTVPDDVLTSILEYYLQFASSYFAKPPTVEHIKKHLNYVFPVGFDIHQNDKLLTMYVSAIHIFSKKTDIVWSLAKTEEKDIDTQIPSDFLSASRPSSPAQELKNIVITSDPVQNAIMEAMADIPLQPHGDKEAFRLDMDSDERMYRLRVLEAKVSAKLAKYKAKKEEDKYYSKFGRLPPDEEDYDDDGDDETDFESEEED